MFALLLLWTAADPIPPTLVPRADPAALAEAAGRAGVTLDGAGLPAGAVPLANGPFWAGVDAAARAAGRRVVVSPDGRRVSFAPGPPAPAAVDGAFRLAVRGVTCRHDYDAGPPVCEVAVDLHWEPRLAVVRVAETGGGKAAVGTARHPLTVRVPNVTRAQSKLPTLDLAMTVTAADRWLTFRVPDWIAPAPQSLAGVTLTPQPARRLDKFVEFRLTLTYPGDHPEFESFESWTATNRCRLVHPDGRVLDPGDNADESHSGRTAAVAYRFPAATVGDLAGWTLEVTTPGPLREFPVRFRLADVPLP